MEKFKTVAILGAGLLGSSLALALKEKKLCKKINIWSRSDATRKKCEGASWCDEVFLSPKEAVIGADLVVLCTTTETIPEIAREVVACMKTGAVATDVGSTKEKICGECEKIFKRSRAKFIGSHPMAGSEKTGPENADSSIFKERSCFVCTKDPSDENALKISSMWKSIGMKVSVVSPKDHDKIVALTSHLPHAVSVNLALTASESPQIYKDFSGNGFLDTTRIAGSEADIWMSIFSDNKKNVVESLKLYKKNLDAFLEALEKDDKDALMQSLKKAGTFRRELRKKFNR